jgi:hypothetical protein
MTVTSSAAVRVVVWQSDRSEDVCLGHIIVDLVEVEPGLYPLFALEKQRLPCIRKSGMKWLSCTAK